jgi:hypothetical protein
LIYCCWPVLKASGHGGLLLLADLDNKPSIGGKWRPIIAGRF